MNLIYRKLKPEESGLYREIRLESLKKFPDAFSATYEEQQDREKLRFEKYIEDQTADKFVVGAFADGILAGICGVHQESTRKTRHRGEIIQMYVKPEYQHKKIGLSLLQAAITEAFHIPGLEQLVLGVAVDNESANQIYRQAGFEEYGIHKHFFKDGNKYIDERLMMLSRE